MKKEIVIYNIDDFKDIESLDDFYGRVNLHDRLVANEITIFDVHMDREECEMLDTFMKETNYKKLKKKYFKKHIESSVGMHWLGYSPNTNNKQVPKGELWIYKESRGNYDEF